MAAGLCSDWRATEGLMSSMVSNAVLDATFHGLQPTVPAPTLPPFGFLDASSSSSLDGAITNRMPVLDHLAFNNGDPLLAMDPFDIDLDLFSFLLPCHPGTSAAYDQYYLESYTTDPTSNGAAAISGGDPFGAGGLIYGPSPSVLAAFDPSPLEVVDVAAATQLQTPGTVVGAAPTAGFSSFGSSCETSTKALSGSDIGGNGGGGCPSSAHSMAARQRRRRISEKTLELGRLIPGGGRMNTAEMLQAAFKYVKFLQAQIGMLDVIGSNIEEEEEELLRLDGRTPPRGPSGRSEQLLQVLLASPAVQEKLAAEGRCVVPTWLLHALVEDVGIKAHSPISTDLRQFMASMR